MKKLTNKRGISLIVLVITIIVMIILASAIILSLSNSGIIGKANKAKTESDNAARLEAANLALAEYQLGVAEQSPDVQGKTAEEYVIEKLDAMKLDTSDIAINKEGKVLVGLAGTEEIIGREYDKEREDRSLTKEKSPIRAEYIVKKMHGNDLYLGATVNYNAGVSGYTGTWKLLGTEEGKLLLISSEPVQVGKTLTGLDDYKNGVKILNDVCKPFGNGKGAISARSITAEDINDITSFDPMNAYNGQRSQEGSTKAYGYKTTYTGISSTQHESHSTNPRLEELIAGNNIYTNDNGFTKLNGQKLQVGEKYVCENTYFSYSITVMDQKYSTYADVVSKFHYYEPTKLTMTYTSKSVDDMLSPKDSSSKYWLATQAQFALASSASWGFLNVTTTNDGFMIDRNSDLFNSVNGTNSAAYDVLAVVTLDSDVELVGVENDDGEIESFDIKL